ncbi:MAG: GntR family transcriptional regulator [Oscillospiraceae bacterium]|nr:GntR family transcriptional regulator [Oscillospiraceae bacterium]
MPVWEEWRLDFDDREPIYRQIILRFCRAFARGDIETGERIPSIREMSALLKVNANTVQRAYQQMERDGLINSKRGTGFFFTEDLGMVEKTQDGLIYDSMRRFASEMREMGYSSEKTLTELAKHINGEETDCNDPEKKERIV